MIEDDAQTSEQNKKPKSTLKITKRGAALLTAASFVAGGVATDVGNQLYQNHEKEKTTVVGETTFSDNPDQQLIDQAVRAAKAIENNLGPAGHPEDINISNVWDATQHIDGGVGNLTPGENLTVEKYESGDYKIFPTRPGEPTVTVNDGSK